MNILYIDADNISYKLIKEINTHINLKNINIKKVYGDWSKKELKNWEKNIYDYGLEPVQCFRIAQKQSTDIKLITDLIEDLHTIDVINNIFLITSDSDFTHVCQLIKKKINKFNSNFSTLFYFKKFL